MKVRFGHRGALILILMLTISSCTLIDYPALVSPPSTAISMASIPQQVHRDILSTGFSDFHHEYGYVKVSLDFEGGQFRTVNIESFDSLGQLKKAPYDYPPHQTALGLTSRLRSLGPSRIAELDAVSGATVTISQIKQAALRAEQRARVRKDSSAAYYEGAFMGTSDITLRGWTTAVVTIINGKISHVRLQGVRPMTETLSDGSVRELYDAEGNFIYAANDASYPWSEYHQAISQLEKRFVELGAENVALIDTVSRATITSTEAKIAVQRALEAAKR